MIEVSLDEQVGIIVNVYQEALASGESWHEGLKEMMLLSISNTRAFYDAIADCETVMAKQAEQIKVLREALIEIASWDMNDASNRIIDITEKALEATKD